MTHSLADIAQKLDKADPLAHFRERFHIPTRAGKPLIYFCGNSLGLQPKTVSKAIQLELEDWAQLGVDGHVHARNPWVSYHKRLAEPLAHLCGAKTSEVVCMNQLTVNLHLLLLGFYRPSSERFKIICEAKAFPSDQYAFDSQAQFRGFAPQEAVIEIKPRPGEYTLHTEDIVKSITSHGSSVALVVLGGVNYYTGQCFDMEAIAKAAHQVGAYCGFDLAHAIGNVPLQLHAWNVDFATWCSYKYLNSGPGGVSGIYVHERFHANAHFPPLAGWWGHNEQERFKMGRQFEAMSTAEAWQMSNAPVLSMAAHAASLALFIEAGLEELFEKAEKLHQFLRNGLENLPYAVRKTFEIITPDEKRAHGCQISLLFKQNGRAVFDRLTQAGIVADWREPNVIRIAPVPLYNSFGDVARFIEIMGNALADEE